MESELKAGYQIRSTSGQMIVIKKLLGGGGQGNVYVVDYGGETKALKWYHPATIASMGSKKTNFYENIKNNALHGRPSPEFVWPIDITEWVDGTFGYVMDLVPNNYKEVSDFLLNEASVKSFKVLVDAALNIISAFRILHNNGFAYLDLNDGNFFIDPNNGKVLIVDNDNAVPNGGTTGIVGKPRFIAPEIVMKKTMPNIRSDFFSMAVIIFYLFTHCHPLEGKRSLVDPLLPELQKLLYGSEALFILDPDDSSNAPVKGIHDGAFIVWPYLPAYMKDIFLKAFGQKALQNPNARPKELDWISCLVRFRSEIVSCSCGNEVFIKTGVACRCEKCNRSIDVDYKLSFRDYSIPCIAGSRIYRCQVGTTNADEALTPMGIILAKADNRKILGLRHLGKFPWDAITSKGVPRKVGPGEVIPVKEGIIVKIKADSGSSGMDVKIESNK